MTKDINSPISYSRWLGLYTLKSSHLIPDGYLANSRNVSCADGSISPFKMYSLFANRLATEGQITHSFTASRADGTEIPVRVRDDGTNSHVEWYNSVDEAWDSLLPTQTTGLTYSFVNFNTSTQDEVWWCNGTENMTLWTPIVGSVASNTATVITLNETVAASGFPSSGTIIVNGTEKTYTGVGTKTLTGLSGLPTFDANEGVAQAADDSTHSALTKYNILHVADGRMWGASTAGVTLAYSAVGDATNWTASTAPANPGSIDLVEGEGPITGISSIEENIFVFKRDLVALYALEYPSATTRTERLKPVRNGNSLGAVNMDGIEKVGETIFYTTRKGGIKMITLTDNGGFTYDDVTDLIRPTISEGVFTSARLGYFENKRILLLAYKKNSDSTRNDVVVAIEFVKDPELGSYRTLGMLDWAVGDWFSYGDDFYFGGSFEPNTFKAFDGYTKDGNSSTSLATTKRFSFSKDTTEQKKIQYLIMTGFLSSGTTLNFQMEYEQMGTLAHLESSLAGSESDYIVEPQFNVIGAFEMGNEPLGGLISDIQELNYFKVYFTLPSEHSPRDVQLTIYSDIEGSRWRIETISFDVESADYAVPPKLKKMFR